MAPEVRLNGPDNEPLGIVPIQEALRMAGELDVDLVEIAATAVPPVCRLMDYGKFKYQEQKKAAEAKAKQTVIEIKEVKFRPVPMMATTTSSCATSAAFWPMATSQGHAALSRP
jgi:translation initiation factor IF-3